MATKVTKKKPKTKDYCVNFGYVSEARTINIMKCDSEITEIKNAEIPIMDLASTGSLFTKQKVEEVKPKNDIFTFQEEIQESINENIPVEPKESGQLSFDDFINDFKI